MKTYGKRRYDFLEDPVHGPPSRVWKMHGRKKGRRRLHKQARRDGQQELLCEMTEHGE